MEVVKRRFRSLNMFPRSPDRLAKVPEDPRSILPRDPRWDLELECNQDHPTDRCHSALITADGAAATF